MKLSRNFYSRSADKVAKDLLGCVLVHINENKKLSGRIVETEAYFGREDPGSHASRGMTPRNRLMFGKPGFAYVYFTYGNHWMFNIVTEKSGVPGAVLIRALEPLEGEEEMENNRKRKDLTSGPGKLTQALGINKNHNGLDLTGNRIYVLKGPAPEGDYPERAIDYKLKFMK